MAADGLSVQYGPMSEALQELSGITEQFVDSTSAMVRSIDRLCESWVSSSSDTYRDDFTKLSDNLTKTVGYVQELIQSTQNYLADMQELDKSYAQSKIQ